MFIRIVKLFIIASIKSSELQLYYKRVGAIFVIPHLRRKVITFEGREL
jgi:hypothetical protein